MIVKAVADALAHGRSVLIASHTHVAVDNVVKDVVDIVDKAGDVVRVGSPTKIDPAVVEHDWLMLDKAAAVITRRDARLREIHSRRSINAEDPARQQLAKVADELDEWDLESVDACYDARELAREANQLLERSAEYGKANLVRDSQISSLATRVETEQRAASELSSLARAGERAERERVEIDRAIHRMTLRSNDVRSAQQTLARRLVEIEDERRGWRARMPAKRKLIEQQFAETMTTTAALAEEGAALERELAGLRDRSSLAQAAAGLIAARNATARAAQQRAATLNDRSRHCGPTTPPTIDASVNSFGAPTTSAHAGTKPAPTKSSSPRSRRKVCPRCVRNSNSSTRWSRDSTRSATTWTRKNADLPTNTPTPRASCWKQHR